MNKAEFLSELEKRLLYIPADDRKDALEYYSEYIDDMSADENTDIIEKLGTPKDVSRDIIDQCTQKHIEQVNENNSVKGKATVAWLKLIGILSLPLSLPLGIGLIAVAICIVLALLAVILSLYISSVAFVLAGAVSTVWGIIVPGFGQKLFTVGIGLTLIGAGILIFILITYVFKLLSRLIFKKKGSKEDQNE